MKTQPKNLKVSVRNKYKRRIDRLTWVVQDFEDASHELIKNGGKIRDRIIIEERLNALETLKKLLPIPSSEIDDIMNSNLEAIFNLAPKPLKK